MIRMIVADDHRLVREALVQMLRAQAGVDVVAEAASSEEVVAALAAHPADLLLLDLYMPGIGGLAVVEQVRARWPALAILVLSMHTEGRIVARALKAGANGYVAKESPFEMLVSAVRKVAAGGRFVDPSLAESLAFDPAPLPLTLREQQVLKLVLQGRRLGEIADLLHLSAKTVSTHKMRLMQKLGVDNNAELIRSAAAHQLLMLGNL